MVTGFKFGYIYMLTSPSGRSYIGRTTGSVRARIRRHEKEPGCTAIHRAIRRHGMSRFRVQILGRFLVELLDLAEIAAISERNTMTPNGYNLTLGGDGNTNPTEETRKKYSLRLMGNTHTKGFYPSEETRAKMSAAHTGRKHSEETKRKIGMANTRRVWSKAARAKIGAANARRVWTPEMRQKQSIRSRERMFKNQIQEECNER